MCVSPPLPPALLLLGPTASGKTACALNIASELAVEIVSVDSALVYRDMDIGTAKPSAAEQSLCPHHLIDVVPPDQSYSAARFREDALRLMREIHARGRTPLLVGGTMLYFKALRDGLSDLPRADPALRAEIDDMAAHLGWPAVHAELARLDAEAATRLQPTDAQRIQRALEIVRLTGRSLADAQARRSSQAPGFELISLALAPSERAVLHQRIADRFAAMLDAGLVGELERLRARYHLSATMPSMRCVGYRQAWDHLEGRLDREGLRERGVIATRQLAKRQLTWQRQFREHWQDLHEFDCLRPDLADAVTAQAAALLASRA